MLLYFVYLILFIYNNRYVFSLNDGMFVTNLELARLLEENILHRKDLAKIPCIRKNSRCLADHIKTRSWQRQRHVNNALNKKLNITDETKFINDVLKLMIADNSDILRELNDDELHISQDLIKKHINSVKKRKRKKKSRTLKKHDNIGAPISSRSEILEIPDFLNTYELNDFSTISHFTNRRSYVNTISPVRSPSNNIETKDTVTSVQTNTTTDNKKIYNNSSNYNIATFHGSNSSNYETESYPPSNSNVLLTSSPANRSLLHNITGHFPIGDDTLNKTNHNPTNIENNVNIGQLNNVSSFHGDDENVVNNYTKVIYMLTKDLLTVNKTMMQTNNKEKETTALKRDRLGRKSDSKMERKKKGNKDKAYRNKSNKQNNESVEEQIQALGSGWDMEDRSLEGSENSNSSSQYGEDDDEDHDYNSSGDEVEDEYHLINTNYEMQQKHNKSRIHKLRLKDMHVAPRQSFGDVPWETYDPNQINWNDYASDASYNQIFYVPQGNGDSSMSPTYTPYDPGSQGMQIPVTNQTNQMHMPVADQTDKSMTDSEPSIMPFPPTSSIPNQQTQMSFPTSVSTVIPTKNLTWTKHIPPGNVRASRVCKPGVVKTAFHGKPNTLIIGDSISLSYSYSVAAALKNHSQVQLAPSSKAGVALDSSYGLQCLHMFLSTVELKPTHYDVVIFNFGLHDVDYLRRYSEEYNNLTKYVKNLRKIKKKILNTGASAAFVLSTPVSFDKDKDELIKKYNHAAKRVMNEEPHVMTINLHRLVTKECGHVPFGNCYMMKKPHDVHYGVTGSIMLGKRIAFAIKYLLDKRKRSSHGAMSTLERVINLSQNATQCMKPGTKCPADYTCMPNIVSRSGHGCCNLQYGVDCGDSWHCCPRGTICHPACTDLQCSCIS